MFGPKAYERYRARALRFGATFEALEYSMPVSQASRFEAVLRLLRIAGWAADGLSILDAGCGHGDFLAYLTAQGVPVGRYLGVDVVPEIIEHARRSQPSGDFRCGTAFDIECDEEFDAAVAIGIFTVRETAVCNREIVVRTLERLFKLSRRVACITVLSTRKATVRDDEYVVDPWDLAREIQDVVSERVIVDHQEMPHVAAIAAYRGTSRWKCEYDRHAIRRGSI